MRARLALRLALAAAGALAAVPPLSAQCTGVNHVTWPAVNPVWDFCWVRPRDSEPGNGSGIELVDVKYGGTLILARAHLPILNVKYAPNPFCGGQNLCYRDWLYSEQDFQCAPCQDSSGSPITCSSSSAVQCTGTTTPAATVCESCSIPPDGCEDIGVFSGVAVEDLGTSLKLTSQCEAGWYRYIPVWEFFADGRIEARFVATSVEHTCVAYDHVHHAYFRFDLDVNGKAGNYVDEVLAGNTLQRVTTERSFSDTSPARSKWRVGSAGSPYVAEVVRNQSDGATGDADDVPNDFPVADGWVLAYNANEISDYQTTFNVCAANLNSFDNDQNVDGADVVLWVRAGGFHEGEGSTISQHCAMVGPTIRVLPAGPPPPASKLNTLTPCRIVDTRGAPGPYGGPAIAGGGSRTFALAGQCNVPPTAKSLAVNVTVVDASANGHLTVYPAGGGLPLASTLNFAAGQTRANNAVLPLGDGGAVSVFNGSAGPAHLLIDVTGWFE